LAGFSKFSVKVANFTLKKEKFLNFLCKKRVFIAKKTNLVLEVCCTFFEWNKIMVQIGGEHFSM